MRIEISGNSIYQHHDAYQYCISVAQVRFVRIWCREVTLILFSPLLHASMVEGESGHSLRAGKARYLFSHAPPNKHSERWQS